MNNFTVLNILTITNVKSNRIVAIAVESIVYNQCFLTFFKLAAHVFEKTIVGSLKKPIICKIITVLHSFKIIYKKW